MQFLAFTLALLIFPIVTYSTPSLSDGEIERIQLVLHVFFERGRYPQIEAQLSKIPSTPEVLQIYTASVRRFLYDQTSIVTRARADLLIRVMSRMVQNIDPAADMSPSVRQDLREDLNTILYKYSAPGATQDSLLSIFDRYRVWGPDNYWFFTRHASDINFVRKNALRIAHTAPRWDERKRQMLALLLREIRDGERLLISCLVYQLAEDNARDRTLLLRLASQQFARAITRLRLWPSQIAKPTFKRDSNSILVAETLNAISSGLAKRKPPLVIAFNSGFYEAYNQTPMGYERDHRVLFFAMLLDRSLDWLNRDNWLVRASQGPVKIANLFPDYRLSDNVIVVDFGSSDCQTQLEPPEDSND